MRICTFKGGQTNNTWTNWSGRFQNTCSEKGQAQSFHIKTCLSPLTKLTTTNKFYYANCFQVVETVYDRYICEWASYDK